MFWQVLFDCILNYPVFGCKVSSNGSWQWARPGVSSGIIAFVRAHLSSSHNPSLWPLMGQDFQLSCPEDLFKLLWNQKDSSDAPGVYSEIIAFWYACLFHSFCFNDVVNCS